MTDENKRHLISKKAWDNECRLLSHDMLMLDSQIAHAVDSHHVWKAAAIGDHADVAVNAMAKRANVDPPSPGAYAQRRTIVATRSRLPGQHASTPTPAR